jgi:hypothetical protein
MGVDFRKSFFVYSKIIHIPKITNDKFKTNLSYLSTLANSILIILFSKMLKFSNIIFSKSKTL